MNEKLKQFLTSQENLPVDKDGKELEFEIIEYEDRPTVIAISIDDTDYLYTLGEHRMYAIDGLNYGDLYCYKNEYPIEEYFNLVQKAYDRDPVITNVRDDSFAMICVNKCEEALGTLKGQVEAEEFRQTAIENTGDTEKNRNFFDAFKDWFEEKKEMLIEYWNIYKPSAKEVAVGTAVFVFGATAAYAYAFNTDTNTQPVEENDPKIMGHVDFYEGGDYKPSAKLEHEEVQLQDNVVNTAIEENVDHLIPEGGTLEEAETEQRNEILTQYEEDIKNSVDENFKIGEETVEKDVVKDVVERLPENIVEQTPTESPSEVIENIENVVEEAQGTVQEEQKVDGETFENLRDQFEQTADMERG